MDGGRSPHARVPTAHLGRTGRVKPATGRRVGVTRAARPSLADVPYHKVLPHGVGAGHRVGIQNRPAGRPPTADRRPLTPEDEAQNNSRSTQTLG